MKERVMKWFKQGLWSEAMVRDAVEKGLLKAEDYKEITGAEYPAE